MVPVVDVFANSPATGEIEVATCRFNLRRGRITCAFNYDAASIEDIAKQDYIITSGRYVGIANITENAEPFEEKMACLKCFKESNRLQEQIKKNLEAIGYGL